MLLSEYLKKFTKPADFVDFAARCQTSVGQLKQVSRGHRRAGESLAINIERESGGLVRCEQLRPDVDWAYLRNSGSAEKKEAA